MECSKGKILLLNKIKMILEVNNLSATVLVDCNDTIIIKNIKPIKKEYQIGFDFECSLLLIKKTQHVRALRITAERNIIVTHTVGL